MAKVAVGGQALIEGIMMKSPDYVATGVRLPSGKIQTKVEKFTSATKKCKLFRLPLIRGIVVLLEMLYVGMRELTYSANQQGEEESMSPWHIVLTIAISLIFALLLFKALPLLVAKGVQRLTGLENGIIFNLIDGIVRISIFIGYIFLISLMKDVKVMFQYHGAEHASISCYESGKTLSVENVRKLSTIHKRCGTSFLMLTLFISILIFSIVPTDMPYWKLFLIRLPLVLPIAGISYEFLKIGDKKDNWFIRMLIMPGLLLQKITTRKPDDSQIEVGIATLNALLKEHGDVNNDLSKDDDLKPNKTMPNKAKPNKAKPNKAKPNKAKPNKAKPNKAKPNKAKLENAKQR